MSYSFSRDRTAEIRDSSEGGSQRGSDGDDFGPPRQPSGYRSSPTRENNPFTRPSRQPQATRYAESDKQSENYEMQPVDLENDQGFFAECSNLKDEIKHVNGLIEKIREVHGSALVAFNEQHWSEMSIQLENLKKETRKRNENIKNRLKAIEQSNAQRGNPKVRVSQNKNLKQNFLETIQNYQKVERDYEAKYRERVERQIRIVKPDASQNEINDIIDDPESSQVFAQSLLQASRRGQARTVQSEVQNRHDDIKKIERTMTELLVLFQEMQMLIEDQGVVLNDAEQNTHAATTDLEQGNKSTLRAIISAKATRAKKWCCFFIVIILCVVIAILVWWFGFNHKGVGDNP